MSKKTVYSVITPLPAGVTRQTVLETLHSHTEMIDLNPLVEERHPIKPPEKATAEEFHCVWYSITDKVSYLPGGMATGKVTYSGCFHDLENGLQTHCYAPMGLDIKGKWTLGGSLPGEPQPPVEIGIGIPLTGLYIREDVEMRCNIVMTSFVKKTLKKAHEKLVARLVVKSQLVEAANVNDRMSDRSTYSAHNSPQLSRSGIGSVHSMGSPAFPPANGMVHPDVLQAQQSYLQRTGSLQQFSPHHSMQSVSSSLVGGYPSPGFPSSGQPSPGFSSPGMVSPGFMSPYGSPGYQVDPAYQNMAYHMQQQHQMTPQQQMMYQGTMFAPSELGNHHEEAKPKEGQQNPKGGPPAHENFGPVELPANMPS